MKVLIALSALALACVVSASVIVKPAGLIPPLDPRVEFNETLRLDLNDRLFKGFVELRKAVLVGLDTVTDDLDLNVIYLDLEGTAKVAKLQLTAEYTIDMEINSETVGKTHVVGSGNMDAIITLGSVDVSVTFKVNIISQVPYVRTINVTPTVATVKVTADGATANGKAIDWDALGTALPAVIDKYFVDHQQDFNEAITPHVNSILTKHTIKEWLEIIGKPIDIPRHN